jgi:bifunctional UDP-N-acetylglucosamine pyrophosphorylase/glucosamine-1-phosphate N-acetyltransferase
LADSVLAVVLAAGEGKRMKSRLPKVLHQVCGRPMIDYVVQATKEAGIEKIIMIINREGEAIKETLGDAVQYVYQQERLGTGHAVLQSKNVIMPEIDTVLVLSGDTPLLTAQLLVKLLATHREAKAAATVVTTKLAEPGGYGRIIRDEIGYIVRIVEEADATGAEKEICEVNAGVYAFAREYLFPALERINPTNEQGEYYLTDVLGLFWEQGLKVAGTVADYKTVLGVNNRKQLAEVEQLMRRKIRDQLMVNGVTLIDPASTFIDATVAIGRDTVIYPYTIITGKTVIGENCTIGPFTQVRSSKVEDCAVVENSVIVDCHVGLNAKVGPYAYLRPGATLHTGAKAGTFVEIKKSIIGENSKVPHLSYVGDTIIAADVNIGAGTITCNYDGFAKHQTIIDTGAFIGSNTNLVAPVRIGKRAITGAGSTIVKDVPDYALGLERAQQITVKDWMKKKLREKGCPVEDEDK